MPHSFFAPDAPDAPRKTASRSTPRHVTLTAILAGVVAVGVISAPGSMAYLQDQATADGVTLTTGSASLAVTPGSGATPELAPNNMMHLIWPAQSAVVSNDGNVSMNLSLALTSTNTTAGSFGATTTFAVWLTADSCVIPQSHSPGLWVGTTVQPSSTSLGTLQPGESSYLCIAAGLSSNTPASAQAGQGNQFTLTLTGNQVDE